jgi:signal transduction histidine kinase
MTRGLEQARGYLIGFLLPVAAILVGSQIGMPAFVFEHLTVLVVVAVAIGWGMGPALAAAVAASLGDNVLLREPIGRPAISGARDFFDFVLFVVVAVTVGWLVTSARRAQREAQDAAARERRAREDRDRLMTAVTHDLATPLSAIRGAVQFVGRFGVTSDTDLTTLMKRVDAAAVRAGALVRALTDLRSVDSGQFALDLQTSDLRPLLATVVQMLEHLSERHRLLLSLPDAPVFVDCDGDRLRGVLENVLTNAVKYSPGGGVVDVSLHVESPEAVIRVRDYGIGVSTEALPHLFERGFRAPEAERMASGLGIGLSLAAEVLRRHRGRIELRPAAPMGTVVLLRLPLASACPVEETAGVATPALPAGHDHDRPRGAGA